MIINGTHTASHAKQDAIHENLNNGFDLWFNGSDFALAPFNLEGASTYTDGDTFPVAGYSWVSKHPKVEGHNFAESLFDYTNGGINTEIPSTFNAHNPRTNPIVDARYFSKLADNSETDILIYSVAPVGDCLDKTQEYLGTALPYQVIEGNYQVIEGNYYVKL